MANLSSFTGAGGVNSGKLLVSGGELGYIVRLLTNTGTTTVPVGTYSVGATSGVGIITTLWFSPTFITVDYNNMYIRLTIDGVTTDYYAGTLTALSSTQLDNGINGNIYTRSISGLYIPFKTSFNFSVHVPNAFTNGRADWYIEGGYIGTIQN